MSSLQHIGELDSTLIINCDSPEMEYLEVWFALGDTVIFTFHDGHQMREDAFVVSVIEGTVFGKLVCEADSFSLRQNNLCLIIRHLCRIIFLLLLDDNVY